MDLAYFRENYRLIAIDLSKPIKLKDPQKSNFIGKLEDQNNEATISSLKNRKKLLLNFYKILWTSYKNGNKNLLNSSENEFPEFATREWYVIDRQWVKG